MGVVVARKWLITIGCFLPIVGGLFIGYLLAKMTLEEAKRRAGERGG